MSTSETGEQCDGNTVKRSLADVLHSDNDVSTSPKRQNIRNDGKENNGSEDVPKVKSITPDSTTVAESEQGSTVSVSNNNDNDVVITSPSKAEHVSVQSSTNDDLEDSPMVVKTNLTNANIQYPHSRAHCGMYNFETTDKLTYCPKCFCEVCGIEASKCTDWATHCQERPKVTPSVNTDEVMVLENSPTALNYNDQLGEFMRTEGYALMAERLLGRDSRFGTRRHYDDSDDDDAGKHARRKTPPAKLRITDVLAEKLDQVIAESELQTTGSAGGDFASIFSSSEGMVHTSDPPISKLAMEGDISQLRLHNSFFVEGVKIGWPFSTILQPQRQMAIHIVKALKRALHVVLESPTGTGKSAAILCSVLAWQRYHTKRNLGSASVEPSQDPTVPAGQTVPTIIYCSRTHSQVAQMVSSLKKTPYRPRMCVLASRDRMCINKDLHGKKKGANINQACRNRKVETDKRRKKAWLSPYAHYDDDHPPSLDHPHEQDGDGQEDPDEGDDNLTDEQRAEGWITTNRRRKPICPHYQQLTTLRNAKNVQRNFVLNASQISCCSVGGEQTTLGAHDVEDLVGFGINPDRDRKIALYREKAGHGSFGIMLSKRSQGGVQVNSLVKDGVAEKDNRLKKWDRVLAVNGINARHWSVKEVTNHIKSMKADPLVLDVVRGNAPTAEGEIIDADNREEQEPYSAHSACPYYTSRALLKHANLVFAPYNYILDPAIRKTLGVHLEGSVVVLDEAHNVESVLCESGSGEFSEIDLCHLIRILAHYSNQKKKHQTKSDEPSVVMLSSRESRSVPDVAHELLIFLEKLINHMKSLRERFEISPGLEKVKQEHEKFKLMDDHSVEVTYQGPTGYGFKGEAIGCAPMLQELGITPEICARLNDSAESLESHLFSGDSESQTDDAAGEAVLNDLVNLTSRFEVASKNPEHFYMACVMKPNGNIDYATSMEDGAYAQLMDSQKWRKHPKQLPFMSPRTVLVPDAYLEVCNHEECRHTDERGYSIMGREKIRHGSVCDGSRPRWESRLVLRLLSPGLLMEDLTNSCRSVILASGSLAPLPSLCAELSLTGPTKDGKRTTQKTSPSTFLSQSSECAKPVKPDKPKSTASPMNNATAKANSSSTSPGGRLQLAPKPLEANHVVDLPKQLYAVSIGNFPDGTPLTVSYTNYKHPSFFPKLGDSIATVIESVPRGGVLVFLPSYSFLKKCLKCWNPGRFDRGPHSSPQTWLRLMQSKGKVIVEPTGSQADFETAKQEYQNTIKEDGNCILLAVFRGKMSEGISFNDDFARCVICVGLPYPNWQDRNIQAKKAYNEEQRKIRNNQNLLPGTEWYSQQAFRAIAQALGRCIRHGADYGAVVLMDSRLCDDGAPIDGICRAHKNLPKWMRHHIRTLSMRPNSGVGQNPVLGGSLGLKSELTAFFQQAPVHSKSVLTKWKLDLEKAQSRSKELEGHTFDRGTGKWTTTTDHSEKNVKSEA